MSMLRRVQGDFQAFLLGQAEDIREHVVGTERVPIATRLGIYGEAYRLRLVEALQANYPALAKLLEGEGFATLGTAYVRANDSRFASIRYYGAGLADFLATRPEYAEAPLLAELARWEWTMTEVFDAADAEPLRAEALQQIQPRQWAELRLDVHPSVRQLALSWNAPQIWKALTEGVERPQASLHADPVAWVLWRQELKTYFRSLEAGEAEALRMARAGAGFGEICAGLARHHGEEETPARAAAFLRQWIASGMVTGAR
jgi:hypothetical protein